jgi:N-acetylglucosaminyldiphosphoundecaprenol N-acetyl-beta-D-mannosaminyltransferase
MKAGKAMAKRWVIATHITTGSFKEQVAEIVRSGAERRSSYVCCVNAHMMVECHKDPAFGRMVDEADLATPDGMPVLRSMQLFHRIRQERVAGNDLMPAVMEGAAAAGLAVYFYGGSEAILARIRDRAAAELPALRLAGTYAPPFGPIEQLDLDAEASRINSAGANIVMVSLGCPKQERWMHAMRGRVDAVMLGVGGAFPLYAGVDTRAPGWMRDLSLEWAYRLWLEPRRLWKRYLLTNTMFLVLFLRDLLTWPFRRGNYGAGHEMT